VKTESGNSTRVGMAQWVVRPTCNRSVVNWSKKVVGCMTLWL